MNQEESKYLELLACVMSGEERKDRTGIGTKSIFGSTLRFSLLNNTLPLLTTKKMFLKGIMEELLFFVRGDTDTKKLEAKGVNIWKGNTSREFLDSKGLSHLPEGDMGKGYGFQWRKFGQVEGTIDEYGNDWSVQGVDQLKNVLESIKQDPFGRRHIVSAWNPNQLNEMALPPCHMMFQFYVGEDNTLSCQWYQRSCDIFLGVPFNIASYALLTHIMAKAAGLKAKEVIFCGGDIHLYTSHMQQAAEQLTRKPMPFPTININKDISTIEDTEQLQYEDFQLLDYKCHPAIKAPMAV